MSNLEILETLCHLSMAISAKMEIPKEYQAKLLAVIEQLREVELCQGNEKDSPETPIPGFTPY